MSKLEENTPTFTREEILKYALKYLHKNYFIRIVKESEESIVYTTGANVKFIISAYDFPVIFSCKVLEIDGVNLENFSNNITEISTSSTISSLTDIEDVIVNCMSSEMIWRLDECFEEVKRLKEFYIPEQLEVISQLIN